LKAGATSFSITSELLDDGKLIEVCAKQGIIVPIGHTSATHDQAMSAILAGVSNMTHTLMA
jgi:N-acetylglucosamine-6-phosphate deacetylase